MLLAKQAPNVRREYIGTRYGALAAPPQEQGVRPSSAGGDGGNPPPGCYPAGTECRGCVQNMVYCCPGGTTWKRKEGWCVGWWDALPCNPLGGNP